VKLALLSDIHSNLEALDSVLEALPEVDRILVLGDIVGYGPDPNAVIERLQSVKARAVRGNHDQAMLDPRMLELFNPHAAAAARWTLDVITPESRRYLTSLPLYGRLGRHRFGSRCRAGLGTGCLAGHDTPPDALDCTEINLVF